MRNLCVYKINGSTQFDKELKLELVEQQNYCCR